MTNGVVILLLATIAIIVIGIALYIALKDGSIFSIALMAAIEVLFFGYMLLTTSW